MFERIFDYVSELITNVIMIIGGFGDNYYLDLRIQVNRVLVIIIAAMVLFAITYITYELDGIGEKLKMRFKGDRETES